MSMITVRTQQCVWCGSTGLVLADEAGFDAWKAGALIQDAFPNLSAPLREQLKSGIHGECWDTMFPEEEEV